MATANEISINGVTYALVADSLLPAGKRAITRKRRDTNVRDPGRIRLVQWDISGPIGPALESQAGGLGTHYATNLDTRFPRRLLPVGKRTVVSLAAFDPPASGTALYDVAIYDEATMAYDSPVVGDDVTHFDEQNGSLFASRGSMTAQVYIPSWTNVATVVHDAPVLGALNWFGLGRLPLGPTVPMQTRTAVTATTATYEDTTATSPAGSVYANAIALGSDRCWITQGDPAGAANNLVTFTLDSFVTMASAFQVGDPRVNINGMGSFGPYTFFGQETGIVAFTDQGKPVPLSRALVGHRSAYNGAQWADPGWGWAYYLADTGLRATNGYTDNPVGIGETMPGFMGHSGRPTALHAERGELFVAYSYGGDVYMYRCKFGPETGSSGQPLMYPFHQLPGGDCRAIYSTNYPTDTAVVWGEGSDMAYETIDRLGRDDLFSDRVYATTGGNWFGTTLDRDPHLLKHVRVGRVRTRNLAGATVQLYVGFDDAAIEPDVEVGAVITTNGYSERHPVTAGVPLTTVSGRSFGPMIVLDLTDWDPDDAAVPAEIAGVLEVEYDERPESIEEIECILQLTGTPAEKRLIVAQLNALNGSTHAGPVAVVVPNELPAAVSGVQYAMVADVGNRVDLKGDGEEAITVVLHRWETS